VVPRNERKYALLHLEFYQKSTLSLPDLQYQMYILKKNGIVQGAILSVNLFLIALRSITSCIEDPSVKIIGYADD
jgi:hypothetical protein